MISILKVFYIYRQPYDNFILYNNLRFNRTKFIASRPESTLGFQSMGFWSYSIAYARGCCHDLWMALV